jgi:lipoprotein-releasing system permease protein
VEKSFFEDLGSRKFLETIAGEGSFSTGREALLGEELARSIGAEPGSTVRIMTVSADADGRLRPRIAPFTVRGIVSSGYRDLDSLWCIVNFEEGIKILPETTPVFLTIKIDDPYNGADAAADLLYDSLDSDFGVYTWKSLQRAQYSSYESTRQLLIFIMALIVLVAAVNVSSATSMLAIERRRDIAVLKTGGGGSAFTCGVFLMCAFLTGLAGSVIGLAAGLLIGVNVNALFTGLEFILSFFSSLFNGAPVRILNSGYYLESIPVLINVPALFIIGFCTVFCSVLASWIPARRAGKLKPIEILRKQ